MDEQDAVDGRRAALGHLVETASYGELILQLFRCALLGNQLDAVKVGGMQSGSMIIEARTLIKDHDSITVTARNDLGLILDDYKQANNERNRLIHDSWTGTLQFESKRGAHHLTARPAASVPEIKKVRDDLESCWKRLVHVGVDALGADAFGSGLDILLVGPTLV